MSGHVFVWTLRDVVGLSVLAILLAVFVLAWVAAGVEWVVLRVRGVWRRVVRQLKGVKS